MSFITYKEKLRAISNKLPEAQRPIRILNAIRVPPGWEAELRKNKFKSLPKEVKAHYDSISLGFEPDTKALELKTLKEEIAQQLGSSDDLGQHLLGLCDQYI